MDVFELQHPFLPEIHLVPGLATGLAPVLIPAEQKDISSQKPNSVCMFTLNSGSMSKARCWRLRVQLQRHWLLWQKGQIALGKTALCMTSCIWNRWQSGNILAGVIRTAIYATGLYGGMFVRRMTGCSYVLILWTLQRWNNACWFMKESLNHSLTNQDTRASTSTNTFLFMSILTGIL